MSASLPRLLLVALMLPIALFTFWGAWELVRLTLGAPQAVLGALMLVAFGVLALAAAYYGVRADPR